MNVSTKVSTSLKSVIFIHVPKAAGTTLNSLLRREYRPEEFYELDNLKLEESISRFKELPSERRAGIRLLKGHVAFGLHEYLSGPVGYVTILRNVADRIISYYYYVRRNPAHYLYDVVASRRITLADFVPSALSPEIDNGQTRLLSGVGTQVRFGACTRNHLEQAIENLNNHFAVVGLSERFDETVLLMRRVLNWKKRPFYIKRNITRDRPGLDEIPRRTIDVIERHNQLDCELYEYAGKLFSAALEENEVTSEKVDRFAAVNNLYPHLYPVLRAMRAIVKR